MSHEWASPLDIYAATTALLNRERWEDLAYDIERAYDGQLKNLQRVWDGIWEDFTFGLVWDIASEISAA